MELLNATRMQAGYAMGAEPSAREHLIVAVKDTVALPERDGDGGNQICVPEAANRPRGES